MYPAFKTASMGSGFTLTTEANETELWVLHYSLEHAAIGSANADAPGAKGAERRYKVLVYEAREDSDDDIKTGLVGDSQTSHESGPDALLLHPLGDDLAPAVNHHRPDAPILKLDEVLGSRVIAPEGATPDLDYNRPKPMCSLRRVGHAT